MTLETYLAELRKKHARLSGLVDSEQKRVAPDTIMLNDLKKQKLLVKQEISRALDKK